MDYESHFQPFMNDRFRLYRGPAHDPDSRETLCNKKLCFCSTDRALLAAILYTLMQREDAWAAKYSTYAKGGMHLGRAFFTSEDTVGRLWRGFKSHDDVFCSVQDDDWSLPFRESDPIAIELPTNG